jgi:hypothetical protein
MNVGGSGDKDRLAKDDEQGRVLKFADAEGGFTRLSAESQKLLLEIRRNQLSRAPRKGDEEAAAG